MKISVIIATYNVHTSLCLCLSSIIPQLTEDVELLVIDGNSDDGTVDIIHSYRDKIAFYISEPDRGVYDAWNKGLSKAKGDWIMFVGADDVLKPDAIKYYLNVLNSVRNVNLYDYICAQIEYVDCGGRILKILGEKPTWNRMRKRMVAAHVASLHNRKNLFGTIGVYDISFKIGGDYELLIRKKQNLKSLFFNKVIVSMTIGGLSFSFASIVEEYKIRKLHHSVSLFFNVLLFMRDCLAFEFFKFHHFLF